MAIILMPKVQAQAAAQPPTNQCGTDDLPIEVPENVTTDTSCFNVEYVMENCVPVYIRTTIHFFADDDCDGRVSLSPVGEYDDDGNFIGLISQDLTQSSALSEAEDLIDRMNAFNEAIGRNYERYPPGANVPPEDQSPMQCNPIRYVLDDVIIHCDSDRQSGTSGTITNYDRTLAAASRYDIFIYNVTTKSGASNIYKSSHSSGNLSPANHIHEAGHSWGCRHTFQEDGCEDTWRPNWQWNGCDGTAEVITGKSCWDDISSSDPRCTDDCSMPHPCCGWDFQTNNVMSYSKFGDWEGHYRDDGTWKNGANMTACQIELMLTTIRDMMCDIVYDEQIGSPCPPVAANVGALPTSDGELDCPPCFYLSTSDNEFQHQIVLLDENGDQLFNSGNLMSEAGQFCLNATQDKDGNWHWPYGLSGGSTYSILLSVQNECGDSDTETVSFALGDPSCYVSTPTDTPSLTIGNISPNPGNGMISIDVDVTKAGNLSIYGVHTFSQAEYGAVHSEYKEIGNQVIQLDISNWLQGQNTLILELEGQVIGKQVTKL